MRETSRRASRKPNRGGIPNVRFIRAAVEALPAALRGIADEIYVLYPWGSLLWAVIAPDQAVLRGIARLGRTGARFHVCINASALEDPGLMARLGLPALNDESIRRWLVPAYAAAGIHIMRWGRSPESPATSWGLRLGQGGPCTVFTLGARVERPAG